ncbi:hypothetical protein K458DRAFT_423171 [Lentithecium fluviatile CBS 122367]|uniref:Impact N-terminal domain-containing protein n=1 Tax=Lentithecium fluviatile CBS 122367 TaxID=1168545 RepID=A0A6G1IKK8_9PLEO|nr:hypothetical protein K458DRAFT_423171 [Lentithecium fluviatile CBS 122367]
MASAQDIQTLLRFLSQDAKVPLAQAMSKIKDLQGAKLITPSEIAKAEFEKLKTVFDDDKVARQVLNAAKRVSKKRPSGEVSSALPPPLPKKAKPSYGEPLDPATFEASLALPEAERDEDNLKQVVVYTNRAPLVLAFAVTLLKYTMPEQPLSSRLSLAQAVCSANSQSKAKYIGLQTAKTAEEEGWGEGQPLVSVMGRQIRVMKRWGYTWREEAENSPASSQGTILGDSQEDVKAELLPEEPALWGVDLEALKKSNGPVTIGERKASANDLPIYRPERTRAYMLKAFDSKTTSGDKPSTGKKKAMEVKGQNLGMLLASLDLLCQSWAHVLSKDDLDKRAWGWYVNVRPEVKSGAAGWGGKGNVALADILQLRRPAS